MAPLNFPRPDRDRKLRGPMALRNEAEQATTYDSVCWSPWGSLMGIGSTRIRGV